MSSVAICNAALALLGGKPITSLNEESTEAQLCEAAYDVARKATLEDREWSFSIRRAQLAPLLETPVWGYSKQFQLPSDLLLVIEARNDKQVNSPNSMFWSKEGDRILADSESVQVLYIANIVNTELFTSSFTQALSARIAHDIAGSITQSSRVQSEMWILYQAKLNEAAATDGKQGRNARIRSSVLETARYGSGGVASPYV